MKARSKLYKLARKLGDIEALTSGSPKKMLNRGKNKAIGKRINKVWRWPF